MNNRLQELIEEKGFVYLGDASESGYADEHLEHYKDWSICLVHHEGELLAVDLIHQPSELWFGRPTYLEWEYDQDDEVTAFAKESIDWTEAELKSAPGQLELLPVEGDRA